MTLSLLFENDNIKDKVSNKMLDGIGGYTGLFDRLKTNQQVLMTPFRKESPLTLKINGKESVNMVRTTLW